MARQSDYETVRNLCAELLDLDAGARETTLAALAESEPELHEEVASILTAYQWTSQTDFLEPQTESSLPDDASLTNRDCDVSITGYEVISELGRGASGVVYHARSHHPIEREVAVKVLSSNASGGRRDRFVAERRTLANFNHPHIAQIYDAGIIEDDRPWVAIEYVEGRSITRYAREHQLDWRRRLDLLLQVCDAVQEVHRKGLIHGDLKPSNILISEATSTPTVKLVDFGSVMIVDDRSGDDTVRVETTLGYAAPERLAGDAPSPESDIFSLGVLILEVLVGHHPLEGLSPAARLQSLAGGEIPTASLREPMLAAPELRAVVERCCDPSIADRPQTAVEVADELRRVLSGHPVESRPRSVVRTTLFAMKRRPLLAGLIVTTTALFLAAAGREWRSRQVLLDASNRERVTLSVLVDNLLSNLEHQSGRIELREILATTVLESLDATPDADADPQLIRHRIQALETLGSIALARDDAKTSRTHRLEALHLIEGLLAETPTASDLIDHHRRVLILVGDTYLHERDIDAALSWYLLAHESLREAHERDPADPITILNLGWSHRRLGSVLAEISPSDARELIAGGLELANTLIETDDGDPRHLHLLGSLRLWEARLAPNPTAHLESARLAFAAATRADQLDPNRWAQVSLLLQARIRIVLALTELDDPDAIPFARETLDLARQFEEENPDDHTARSIRGAIERALDAAISSLGTDGEPD